MSFSDTAAAKQYASIAEVAAAEAKGFAEYTKQAENFSEQAKASADDASQSALSASEFKDAAAVSATEASGFADTASEKATEAALSAQNASIASSVYPSVAAAQAAITAGTIPLDALFNVIGAADTSYVDQYQNVAGVATPTGRSYPSTDFVEGLNTSLIVTNNDVSNINARTGGLLTLSESVNPIEEVDQTGKLISYYDSTAKRFYPGGMNSPKLESNNVTFGDGIQLVSNDTDPYFNPELDLANNLLWGTRKDTAEKVYIGRMLLNYPGLIAGDFSAMGDSITAFGIFNGAYKPVSWHTWASIFTDGQVRLAGIYATGGMTATEIMINWLPSAVAARNTFCVVMCGRNDVIQGIDIDNVTIPAFKTIYRTLMMNGIIPVVCTMAAQGNSSSSTQRTAEHKINNWLRAYARKQRLPFVDLHKVTVDPVTGDWLAGYASDVSHPTPLGARVMGQQLANTLTKWCSPTLPEMAEEQITASLTNNILSNPLFYTLNGGGTAPQDFTVATAGTSSITTDPKVKGNVWKLNGGSYNKSVTLIPGTKMGFGFFIKSSTNAQVECYLAQGDASSGTYLTGLRTWDEPITDMHYSYGEFTVPTGVTQGTIVVNSGAVDLYLGCMGLFTLTEVA